MLMSCKTFNVSLCRSVNPRFLLPTALLAPFPLQRATQLTVSSTIYSFIFQASFPRSRAVHHCLLSDNSHYRRVLLFPDSQSSVLSLLPAGRSRLASLAGMQPANNGILDKPRDDTTCQQWLPRAPGTKRRIDSLRDYGVDRSAVRGVDI